MLLGLFLVVDALLIGLHLSGGLLGEPSEQTFDLSTERGYGEFFQYVKALWIVLMLLGLWRLTRQAVLVAWAGVFAWIALDDALMLHERGGGWLAEHTGVVASTGQYANHVGEGVYFALAGIVVAAGLALAHRFVSGPDRVLSWRLVVLGAVGVFFAVGVDAVQVPFYVDDPDGVADVLLTALEDGGELTLLSVVAAVLLTALLQRLVPDLTAADAVAGPVDRPEALTLR